MSKIPVIIAAHNEADYIGRCLTQLPSDLYEPIVAANACEDGTVGIAQQFGVTVVANERKGKLPAIQEALAQLGQRALEPVLFLDADSYPSAPRRWAESMVQPARETPGPVAVAGLLRYVDGNPLADAARTLRRARITHSQRNERQNPRGIFGANMLLSIQQGEVLDGIMAMPHIWPGEDAAMGQQIVDGGGTVERCVRLGSVVNTSARYHTSLVSRLVRGRAAVYSQMVANYEARGSGDSVSYDDLLAQQQTAPVAKS